MIVEFLVELALGFVDLMVGWLPASDAWDLPELAPLFGYFVTLDYAAAGVLSETLLVVSLILSVMLVLFMFAVVRAVFGYVPFIGGR
jgi:hypothetical protein